MTNETANRLSEDVVKSLTKPATGNKVTFYAGATLQGITAPPGFGVRVTSAGAKAFILDYRIGGVQRRFTIGLWQSSPSGGAWSVIAAMKAARDLRKRVDDGKDIQGEKEKARSPEPNGKTVKTLLADFVTRYVRAKDHPLRSADAIESAFERLVIPSIGKIGIYDLRRSHVVDMLDKIEDENGAVMCDRVLAFTRKAFTWHATRDDHFVPPFVRGMARTKPQERARTRILSDDEIRDVWAALATMDKPSCFSRYVRMLLLTGQRRAEVAGMRWDEIDGTTWIIPAARYKTKLDHAVPITDAVRTLIGTKQAKAGPFVFSTDDGASAFTGYGKPKAALDAKIAEARSKMKRESMPNWTYHDSRRSARSLMARAGVSSDHAERVLGHVMPGVRATYDRHGYLAEKREALDRLAALVTLILALDGAKLAEAEKVLKAAPADKIDATAIIKRVENMGKNVVTLKDAKRKPARKRVGAA